MTGSTTAHDAMLEEDAARYREASRRTTPPPRSERRDLRDELDRFEGYPAAWIPDVGDVLVGEILRYGSGPTAYGRFPVVTVADEETGEELSVWLLHTALRSEFAQLRPRIGERIGIRRLEDGTSDATGHTYRRFLVRVDRPEGELPVLEPDDAIDADDFDFGADT